jgi:hypothetical protein
MNTHCTIRLCIIFACAAGHLGAQDFSSTNTTALSRFWNAAERRSGPITVVAFGDSLQATWRSAAKYLYPLLSYQLGQAGVAFPAQLNNMSMVQSGGPVVPYNPDTNWWDWHTGYATGAYVFWTNQFHPSGSIEADRGGIYYVAGPEAGTFTISLSTNGGHWTSNSSVNAFSPNPEGRLASFALDRNAYRLRVDSITGTNIILGQELVLTSSNGIKTVFLQKDGLNLGQFFNVPDQVLSPIFTNLHPDLILWHMKELGDAGQDVAMLSNRLEHLEALWQASAPDADVIYIGTPYAYGTNINSSRTVDQNVLVRTIAVNHGRAYVDGMTPMISYSYMTNNGYLDDDVHPSNKYYQWLADTIWRQTLFSLLRKDRSLKLESIPDGYRLTCPRFSTASQNLLGSTNLIDWSIIQTNGPGTQPWLVTNPPGNFFRTQFVPQN